MLVINETYENNIETYTVFDTLTLYIYINNN